MRVVQNVFINRKTYIGVEVIKSCAREIQTPAYTRSLYARTCPIEVSRETLLLLITPSCCVMCVCVLVLNTIRSLLSCLLMDAEGGWEVAFVGEKLCYDLFVLLRGRDRCLYSVLFLL